MTHVFGAPISAVLALLIGLHVLLLGGYASQSSFWEDETFTAQVVLEGGPAQSGRADLDVHGPTYYGLAWAWAQLFGASELGLRSLSIGLSALVMLGVYRLARRNLAPQWALMASALYGLSPLTLLYAGDARDYALVACLSLVMISASLNAVHDGRWRWAVLYTVAGAGIVNATASSALVVAGVGLGWLIALVSQHATRRQWAGWLAAHGLVGVAGVAAFADLQRAALSVIVAPDRVPSAVGLALQFGQRLGYLLLAFATGETLSPLNPLAIPGMLAVVALTGAAAGLARARKPAPPLSARMVVAFLLLGGSMLSIFAAYPISLPQAGPRHLFAAFPIVALWWACACAAVPPRWAAAGLVVLALSWVPADVNVFAGRQYMSPILAVPWRAIVGEIGREAVPGAVVVCSQGDTACTFHAARAGLPLVALADLPGALAARPPEVWWVQSNVGSRPLDADAMALAALARDLRPADTRRYAEHDPSIRQLKRWLSSTADYADRVEVVRYVRGHGVAATGAMQQ